MFGKNKLQHDQTLFDLLEEILENDPRLYLGRANREKGILYVVSNSTHVVHRLRLTRVR
jgi:hypothetical protein